MAEMKFQVYRVVDLLQNKEAYTASDLAHELGVHVRTAQRHLKELYVLDLVYICGWDKEYHQTVPVYKWGNKDDEPRPTALTKAQIAARHRERKKRAQISSNL
jgi:DNA-binding IclR family transcriptional regulator